MRSRSEHEQKDFVQPEGYRELRLLSEVEENPKVTQRQLSTRLGIALGLTNVLIRNLAQKGYLRASRAGWKRWVYALTPDGFTYKFRLTVGYIARVLDHYQTVRQILREEIKGLAMNEETRVAMYGTGEFAELIYLGLKEIGVEEIDFYAAGSSLDHLFLGKPVRDIATIDVKTYDRILVASLGQPKGEIKGLNGFDTTPEQLVTFLADGATKTTKKGKG